MHRLVTSLTRAFGRRLPKPDDTPTTGAGPPTAAAAAPSPTPPALNQPLPTPPQSGVTAPPLISWEERVRRSGWG